MGSLIYELALPFGSMLFLNSCNFREILFSIKKIA